MRIQAPDGTYCHKLVAETAKNFARLMHQRLCTKDNAFFAQNPSEDEFVRKVWGTLIEDARATLVDMLSQPLPDALKDQIATAIIADNTLTRGRLERVASRMRTGQSATMN